MKITSLLIAAGVLRLSGPVLAQTVAPAPSGKSDCAPTQATPNDPNSVRATGNRPLTEKLADSGGVLCPPPAVDSDMRVPAPRTGSNMPVVPPPGSPGGDQTVQPK